MTYTDRVLVLNGVGGSKLPLPLYPYVDEKKCIVFPINGSRVPVQVVRCYTGDAVAVVNLDDGNKVCCNMTEHAPISDSVEIYTYFGGNGPGDPIRVRATLSRVSPPPPGWAIISLNPFGNWDSNPVNIEYEDIGTDTVIETEDFYSDDPGTQGALISVQKGAYVKITKVEQSLDSGDTWSLVTDGDFSSGVFVTDMAMGWVKNEYGFSAQMVTGGCETIDL